jgi:flagellar basal-body rod modification protein FlgD
MGTTTTGVMSSALSALASTAPTTQVGSQANQTEMNQFLTLLTTELQNQDPTQPTDPTAFVTQLAEMTSVQAQVQTNTTLTSMSQQLSGMALGQYTGLINQNVSATLSSVSVPSSGSVSIPMSYNVTSPSLSNINISITNSSGVVVGTLPVSGTSGGLTFNGTTAQGNTLPAGQYTLSLVGTSGSGATATTSSAGTLSTNGSVSGVTQDSSGNWELQLNNGQTVEASSVTSAN